MKAIVKSDNGISPGSNRAHIPKLCKFTVLYSKQSSIFQSALYLSCMIQVKQGHGILKLEKCTKRKFCRTIGKIYFGNETRATYNKSNHFVRLSKKMNIKCCIVKSYKSDSGTAIRIRSNFIRGRTRKQSCSVGFVVRKCWNIRWSFGFWKKINKTGDHFYSSEIGVDHSGELCVMKGSNVWVTFDNSSCKITILVVHVAENIALTNLLDIAWIRNICISVFKWDNKLTSLKSKEIFKVLKRDLMLIMVMKRINIITLTNFNHQNHAFKNCWCLKAFPVLFLFCQYGTSYNRSQNNLEKFLYCKIFGSIKKAACNFSIRKISIHSNRIRKRIRMSKALCRKPRESPTA